MLLLSASTGASGLVPQPGPSMRRRLTFGFVALLALVATGAAIRQAATPIMSANGTSVA